MGDLEKTCYEKFVKFTKKIPVPEHVVNKVVGMQPAALLKGDSAPSVAL